MLLDTVVPACLRLISMLGQLAVLAVVNVGSGTSTWSRLDAWDGRFYEAISAQGYTGTISGAPHHLSAGSGYAFFPLFPSLSAVLRVVMFIPPAASIVVVAWISSTAAGIVTYRLVRELAHSRRTGYIAVLLLGALPMSISLMMGYAESTYCLLAALALLYTAKGSPRRVAVVVMLAGLSRPTGIILCALVPLADRQRRRSAISDISDLEPRRARNIRDLALLTAFSASSPFLYFGYVWTKTRQPFGWFRVESDGWGTHFDFGRSAWHFIATSVHQPTGLVDCVTVVVVLGYVVIPGYYAIRRSWLPLMWVVIMSVIMVLGSTNFWHSRPRLLIAAFPIVVPLAISLAKRSNIFVASALITTCGIAFWFGAYMLAVWPYAI